MSIARIMQQAAAGVSGGGWDLSTAVYNGTPVNSFSVGAQETAPTDVFFKSDGTKMYVVGSTGDAVYEYDLSTAWDLATASYVQNFSVAAQETAPTGLFFKPDGLKMYVIGTVGDDVNEYNLSTAWDISTASYLQNFSVNPPEANPQAVFFKPDGLKMYIMGLGADTVYEYDLSPAWDVSTAAYSGSSYSVAAQEANPMGMSFRADGLRLYVIGATGDDVNEYNLNTAWDVSSAYYSRSFSVVTQETNPQAVFFKSDGLKMYIVGQTSDTVYQYDLSTAWAVNTASYVHPTSNYFYVGTQDLAPSGLFLKPDGLKMYVMGPVTDAVYEYDLSTEWDISTASYLQSLSVAAQEDQPTGVFFKPDGTKMYVTGTRGDDVNEYDLSTAWDVSTASYLQNFSVASELSDPHDIFFKPDGLTMYVASGSNALWAYTLSTAWDISTASIPSYGRFSVAAQESVPTDVFFKTDGTKMYVLGSNGDDVNEYDLSTAWDISTASYLQNFSVATQEAVPNGLFFKPDGTTMYVIGSFGDDVNEYSLSTAWDVTTASYVRVFSVLAQENNPHSVFFRPDGLRMYVIGTTQDTVFEYSMTTAWNISTASYTTVNYSVSAQELNPRGVFFKPDGTKMYVIGSTSSAVHQYNLSTAWNVSTSSYVQSFSVLPEGSTPEGFFFKDDGTKMYVIYSGTDAVNEYTLSTAWDISTASFDGPPNAYFAFRDNVGITLTGVTFKPDGTKMYSVNGGAISYVYEYDLSTDWDISTASYVQNFSVSNQEPGASGVSFKPDGLEMYVIGSNTDAVYSYDL